ncbi:sce7726 family protein [Achromobacter xylosoxidans]|uniref:sce7726 family protein n=1 Tax=Alcaligenes xylosoxydans xylosoxydans TaxID=85698 RepID=UPI0015CB16C8|nr:sce7726 family protein [Achromobacter xylosoxidans]NYS13998.1 sce7726 family protein [Achromobacter xylosoxidans]
MGGALRLDANRSMAFSRLFSSSVFKEMAGTGRSPLFARLVRQSFSDTEQSQIQSVGDAFNYAFGWLSAHANRDEYVYKAAITQRILLGRHSLRSACMLNEFRVGLCKVDLAILNGTATAYEIKSERDGLGRLKRQLDAYQLVFPRRFVIAGENHIDGVLQSTGADVGVLMLSSRYRISTIRDATERMDLIQSATLFDTLRIDEAIKILNYRNIEIPVVPNTRIRGELREIFTGFAAREIYPTFVKVLKESRSLASLEDLLGNMPRSLHAAALTIRVKPAEHKNLLGAINSTFVDALGWA